MTTWIYLTHPRRDGFSPGTMTAEEQAVFADHLEYLSGLLDDGVLVLAGPTEDEPPMGVTVIEAPDEASARAIVAADPVVASGLVRAELRPLRLSLLRGRDG